MDPKALDKVLNCASLPSLPGVAIKMLELMRQTSSTAEQIASVIQHDPALAAKVLRTVNSSYYGLSKPCPTIARAVSFLGLNTVKSLTLGLSLVDMAKGVDSGFDLVAYWRRAVYCAAASRILARLSHACDPDEAFIGCLLQDIGMLGCFAALGVPYEAVVADVSDHEQLPAAEQEHFGFDHAEAGARMSEKWRLPEQIIACTRYHHRAVSAPEPWAAIVRVVACSGDAAAALDTTEPHTGLVAFRQRAWQWFNIDADTADEILHQTGAAAKELSKLLELNTGAAVDVSAILADAGEQLLHHQVDMDRHQNELARESMTDALTGVGNRRAFNAAIARAFDEARASGRPLSILFADADRFKSVNDTLGHQAGDLVLTQIAQRIREAVGDQGQTCRYGGEEFAVILPGVELDGALQTAEMIRRAVEARPVDVSALGLRSAAVNQTISLGVATDTGTFPTWEALIHAADDAVYAAKKGGRNRVCTFGESERPETKSATMPAASPPAPAGDRPLILVVEDDPLSAKMLEVLLVKHGRFDTVTAKSGEEALKLLRGDQRPPLRPRLALIDLHLPATSGLEFLRSCRSSVDIPPFPVVIMSARATVEQQREVTLAGAEAFLHKNTLCNDLSGAVRKIAALVRGAVKHAA